jgi:RHS repeat-associated protein
MGTVSAAGLYTAPATISTRQTVVVTATSVADPTKSASATITLIGASGTLSESFGQLLTNIDLTKEGTADWAAFGPTNYYSYGSPLTRKASVTPLIPLPSAPASYQSENWLDYPGPFSFEDGYPDVEESGILPVAMVTGSPSPEFDFVIPADTTQRTLKIYGSVDGSVQMTATLSDNSAPAITDSSLSNTGEAALNGTPYFYAITYNAASAGQTLTIKFIATNGGYIYLNAATLTGSPVSVPPVVTSISPSGGSVGSTIAISGSNFGASQGSSTVTLGGVPAPVSSWSSSGQTIEVVVPVGAQSGPVQVVTNGGPSNTNVLFTLAPTVTNLSPSQGPVGTVVTINGYGFGASQGTGSVTFNGVAASPSSWMDSQIIVPVPAGASTGDVVVTQVVAATSTPLFTVLNGAQGTQAPILQIGLHDSPLTINLSSPENQDWVIWGADGVTPSATRNAQANLISDVTVLGGDSPAVTGISGNLQYNYIWTNGVPTASGNISMTGISVSDPNAGFQLTAPADTTVRTLKIYSYGSGLQTAQVNASISDGSSAPVSFTLPYVVDYASTLRVYSIDYRAGSAGQTLTVQLVSLSSGVSIEAAILSPHLPDVGIVSPQEGQEFFQSQAAITFGVDAMQFDSAVTSVGVSANKTQQFSMQAPFLSTWSPAQGHYSVQAQATDASGLTNTSDPVHVDVIGSGGTLSVGTEAPPLYALTDLTSVGTADWILFGTPGNVTRKAGVAQLISNAKIFGDETPYEYQDYNSQFAFEDGTPIQQETSVEGGLNIYNGAIVNNGFEITVKADTVPRTLRLYVAAEDGGGGKLKAYLSDGSAPVYVDTSLQATGNPFTVYQVYVIHFSAASAGQTLTVRWSLDAVTNSGGSINLYAATLDGPSAIPAGPAITQISPTSGGLGTNVTISGSGFGASQGTSTVTFNGVVATPTSWSDTQIQVPAPATSNTGNIVVTVAGVASDPELFSMPPTITSLSASTVAAGSVLTINGFNFGLSQGSSGVGVYNAAASVLNWSDSQIQIVVPEVPLYSCYDPVNCNTYLYVYTGTGYSNYVNFTEANSVQLSPATAAVYAGQTQAYTLVVASSPVSLPGWTTWSIVPAGVGTIDQNGLYTAPASISSQQSVTVIGTVEIDPPSATATATITLEPPVAVSISPTTATLFGGQTQQFTGTVVNALNTAVTWTVSPSSAGSINSAGLYTAPSIITSFQSITITATSQADPTQTASATITLSPPCTSAYAYRRILTIDHTKVPNTDQTDFPVLVSGIYPSLATVANGGHVQNANGYDIILTSDPTGQIPLDFEIDTYNPTNGQMAMWVRIPTVSHTLDTPVYLWYGNPNITASQENKTGVWKNNFLSVYHFGSGSAVGLQDSASSGYTLAGSATSATGMIGGAASFSGDPTQYLSYENASAYPGGTSAVTLEAWTQFPASGGGAVFGYGDNGYGGARITLDMGPTGPGMDFRGIGPYASATVDTNWHHVVGIYDGGRVTATTTQLYVDGVQLPESDNDGFVFIDTTELKIGGIPTVTYCCAFTGSVDEVRVSSGVRSADWIATEFNSESSPNTFYRLSVENAVGVQPDIVSLYGSQTLQFSAIPLSPCSPNVTWSISPVGAGTISAAGLYTSPASIQSRQVVTVTAVSQADPSQTGTATVTLLPTSTTSTLVLSAVTSPPYVIGSSPTFAVTLKDQNGTPEAGVEVDFTVTGVDSSTYTAITDGNGVADYTYPGNTAGVDTIQASATVSGQLLSGTISISWTSPIAANAPGGITLVPAGISPTLNLEALCGAFTDSSGNVIEPLAIGDGPKQFVVPSGATQLQLGVDDGAYFDNFGPGFVVNVNGTLVTVPPGAMPWVWVTGGLNSNYAFGLQDGTPPLVAATNLTPGQNVVIAYQSGLNSPGGYYAPIYDANGVPGLPTGVGGGETAAYAPTHYMTALSYTLGSSISFEAMVTDVTGTAMSNVPVTFTVAGANAQQFTAPTGLNGIASFTYTGGSIGTDTVQAQASLTGGATLTTSQTIVVWRNAVPQSATGVMSLTPTNVQPMVVGSQQAFTAFATDSNGNPQAGVDIALVVTRLPYEYLYATTDSTGHASFLYTGTGPGTATLRAVALIDGGIVYSNIVDTTWTPATSATTSESITVNISAQSTLTLPNALALIGTVTDTNSSATLTEAWTQVSGPGVVTFANPQQASTTATFSQPGDYVVQLSASDSVTGGSQQFQVSVQNAAGNQGWIGSPAYGDSISGIVPITTTPGVVLQSGILTYYSASNPDQSQAIVLNRDANGSGQIGTIDATQLKDGSYWIQLVATDTNGNTQYSDSLVTVVGQYKPGRVTTTVTDLVVPATGLAINVQRQYDSLNAATISDFGYGWSLSTNVDLAVDASHNVTFTLGGQRRTFYFTPQYQFFFLGYVAGYTPEPGLSGTLTAQQDPTVCPFGYVVGTGSFWECGTGDPYSPLAYTYTDGSGTQYAISASGSLNSVTDIDGNSLTITRNGITSSTGLNVPFVRDASGRITKITDPQGNNYLYGYDSSGNLASVTYPTVSQPSTYTYDPNHLYLSGTDFRNNPLPTTAYYGSTDTDPNGLPLNGRLKSVQDALGETTSYAYNLTTNTTTITYPPDATGHAGTATKVYDSYGMLLSLTDPLGLTTTNVYDSNHNLTSVMDPLGHINSYTYDINGNRTSSTYPQVTPGVNTTRTVNYNQYSEPSSITDELGNVRTFNYDANNNPQSVTDTVNGAPATLTSFLFNANGTLQAGAIGFDIAAQPAMASQFTYDVYGNRTSQTDALGRMTAYTYNALGQRLTETKGLQASGGGSAAPMMAASRRPALAMPHANVGSNSATETTTYVTDALGLVSEVTSVAGPTVRATSSTYDANGNRTSYTDPNGNVTIYQYDALNRLTTITYPTQPATTTTITYDFRNNVIDETDPAGHITHHIYDLSGRLISVTKGFGTAAASTTSFTYYTDGHRQGVTDALGHTTSYAYDVAGRLISVTGINGTITYSYDAAGNRISTTDGNGHTTQFQYDSRKRLVATIYPDSTSMQYSYDGAGNLINVTDQAGNAMKYTYDAANELQSVVQVNSPSAANVTAYSYDLNGNLANLTDANGHSTVNTYDPFSDLLTKTLPDGSQTEARTFDPAGNLLSLQHFNGTTTTYTYDQLNRLLTRTPDSSLSEQGVVFTYTATGKPATMTDASGTTTFAYDPVDRLTAKITPEGTLNYTYDASGRVSSISSANLNGASMSYTYDSLNRLSTVVDNRLPSGQNTTTYAYDSASNLATVTYPNQLTSTVQYDSLNRLTALNSSTASYAYQLGPTGNRTSATESTGRTLNWSYDGIYRLTNEAIASDPAGGNGAISYGLDPVGNRSSATSTLPGIPSSSASFDPDDLQSTESYDANKNTTYTGGRSFAYDSENRLTSMNGSTVSIVYDGFGNRVAETAGGVTTRYLVEDDVNPTGLPQVFDETVNGVVQRTYTYGFERISEDQLVSGTWTPSFYQYDGGGSVRQLTSLAGAVTDSYNYDAFGNLLNSTGSTPNNYLYRGEQYDASLNLYYLRARFYNPATGRFLSRDPYHGHIGSPSTLHKYAYASDDPVNRVDPLGLEDAIEVGGADSAIEDKAVQEGLTNVQERVDCMLNTAAATLLAITFGEADGQTLVMIAADFVDCDAEAQSTKKEPAEPKGCCFAAGTPVHTDHGDVPVEQIEVGDEVLSRNSTTGKLESEPVTALTPRHQDSLVEIRIEGDHDALRPSTSHPFWVKSGEAPDGSWVQAGKMRVGDLVQTTQGYWRRVVAITPLPGQEAVYNFTVDKDHDYFVGQTGFLVHNADCGCQPGFGTTAFGNQVHQYFGPVLQALTGTGPEHWIMRTAPGLGGVDATYIGPPELNPGFNYAELKPMNYPDNAVGCQIGRWGLPDGETSIFWYNRNGIIGQTLGRW